MDIQAVRAPARANHSHAARDQRVARALRRFRAEAQPAVRALAARHAWLADLALSFPALLFALAHPRRGALARAGLQRVLAGASLPAAAEAAGVPIWLRAFPPEAFAHPIAPLPDSAAFRRRIANHPPKSWRVAPAWLDHVSSAATWGDEAFAVWLARELPPAPRHKYRHGFGKDPTPLLALWAWHSQRPETEVGAQIAIKWTAPIGWTAAQQAARAWIDALALTLWMNGEVLDAWLEPGEAEGFAFVPLRRAADLVAEAEAMRNCVGGYSADIARNFTRVWSVRRDGARVATLSLNVGMGGAPFPHIGELSGLGNAVAPPEVWRAARRWLHAQDMLPADPARFAVASDAPDFATWRRLWRPYWLAKRRIPAWLPLAPNRYTLEDI